MSEYSRGTWNTLRYRVIKVKDKNHPEGFTAEGLFAAVIQHEIDHMDGLLFLDRVYQKIGPNEPCICGSGRKYKKCCGKTILVGG